MSSQELHEAVKRYNNLSAGNPERDKLAQVIEQAIKQKLGEFTLKVV